MKISINGNLTPKQMEVLNGIKRFTIFRAGRRLGKSYLASYYLVKFALTHPNCLCWQVTLDISTSVELSMPYFERLCPPELIVKKNSQTRTFTLINGARVVFKTAETAEALRGRGLDLVILEECAFWKNGKALWNDILRPQLVGNGGRALFISSPNGSNWMRQLEMHARDLIAKGNKEWAIFTGTIADNPSITQEEIDLIRESTPESVFNQEYLGQYEDSIGHVYWDLDERRNVVNAIPQGLNPIYTIRGMDWGLADDMACVWMQPLPNKKVYVFSEHSANGLDVQAQAKIIHGKTFVPIKWSVLDSSCWNRDASMTSVARRFSACGIPVVPATKDFDGSVSDVKLLLSNGDILIHNSCKRVLEEMKGWVHGTHEPDCLAAFRYGIASLIKAGALIPPIKINKPWTPQQMLKDEKEFAKRSAKLRKNLGKRSDLTFRIINQ